MNLKKSKKTFHFKELLLSFIKDAFDCILFILFMIFVVCSIPFVLGVVLSYFELISFELGFGGALMVEFLFCIIWALLSSLIDKYYY